MSDIQVLVSRQVKKWDVERKAHEEALKENEEHIEPSVKVKPVITISRQRGCRGYELAKLLAHELQYGLFDRTIVDYIAQHMGVRSELVESLDEKNRSELELWVSSILSQKVFDHDEYIHALSEAVKTTALQGGVVILGRGSNFILAGTGAFHLRFVAPLEYRIRTLCEFERMNEKQAMEEIRKVDQERSDFVYRYFKRPINDPAAYDLTINMENTTLNSAVKIALTALRAKGWSWEMTGGEKRSSR